MLESVIMENVSFRGNEIPVVNKTENFKRTEGKAVINKLKESNARTTIVAAHFDNGLSDVKLDTGDIVSLETAIALASADMLTGFSTGATITGKRTLRSKPSAPHKIYELPRF